MQHRVAAMLQAKQLWLDVSSRGWSESIAFRDLKAGDIEKTARGRPLFPLQAEGTHQARVSQGQRLGKPSFQ